MTLELSEDERKRIIIKDSVVQVNLFFGDDPSAFGHIVIQPRNNADDISQLEKNVWLILSEWIPKVSNAMKKVLREISGKEVQKIYLCSFNESTKYPVHFHLVPRYENETLKGPNLLFHRANAKLMVTPQERDKIVRSMKKELGISEEEKKE